MDMRNRCRKVVFNDFFCLNQKIILGQEMAENGIEVDHVFTSPSLRCIQTADGLLKGLGPKGVIQ